MRPTDANGSSSTRLLPTPEANQASNGGSQHPDKRQGFGNHSVQLQDVVEHVLPTPMSAGNAKSARSMQRSKGDQRTGGGHSSIPGLEEIGTLLDGERPEHMPPDSELGAGTRELVQSLLPTPKIKDRASRGPGADGGPDLGEAVSLLNSPSTSEGTGVGVGRRKESTLRGQVDQLDDVLPTPRTGSNRNSRRGLVPQEHNHWAAPALEQVAEPINGELPREYEHEDEVKGAARALLPTPGTEERGADLPDREGGQSLTEVARLMPTPTKEHASRSSSVADRNPNSKAHIGTTMMDMVDELHVLPTPAAARAGDTPEAHLRKKPGRTTVTNLEVMATGGMLPTPRASDGTNGGPNQRGSAGDLTLPSAALSLLPTPDAQMGGAGGRSGDPELARAAGHHVTINEVAQHLPTPSTAGGGERNRGGDRADELLLAGVVQERAGAWGPYEPAIRRWERVLGRVAPWATEPSPRSKRGRLSPRFVEWMMGWAEGWVTSVPGLSRNQQLKILGNGVVPQQAAEAIRFLLAPPPIREHPKPRPRKGLKRSTARAMLKASREV